MKYTGHLKISRSGPSKCLLALNIRFSTICCNMKIEERGAQLPLSLLHPVLTRFSYQVAKYIALKLEEMGNRKSGKELPPGWLCFSRMSFFEVDALPQERTLGSVSREQHKIMGNEVNLKRGENSDIKMYLAFPNI